MNKSITIKQAIPEAEEYFRLFETTGWNNGYNADKEELFAAINTSWYTLCAYNGENELIGFGRLISDGVLYAFVCDMIILPEYQKQGIGSSILEALIQHCRKQKVRVLWLFSASEKSEFYKKFGFEERPTSAPGMQLALNIVVSDE